MNWKASAAMACEKGNERMSIRWLSVLGVAALLGFPWRPEVNAVEAAKPPAQSTPLPPGETVDPAGAYQVAWLALDKAWPVAKTGESQSLPLFLGLRDGQGAAAWFAARFQDFNGKGRVIWYDRIGVTLSGGSLKGPIEGRVCGHWGPMAVMAEFTLDLDVKVEGEKASGTFTATVRQGGKESKTSGAAAGTVCSQAQMKKTHAIRYDWPSYFGVTQGMRGADSGLTLVDALDQCRPVWKSEQILGSGWGSGADGRYSQRAAYGGVCGGSSTPVVAGGKVYYYAYTPSGPIGYKGWPIKTNEQLIADVEKLTPHPWARRQAVDFHRLYADDVILSMDAATGQTLWKATFPERSINIQTHKYRGPNPTPCVDGDRLYVQTYCGAVYCFDRQTGKLIWEHRGGRIENPKDGKDAAVSPRGMMGPVVADGVVAVPLGQVVGFEAASGAVLWKAPAGNVVKWTFEKKTYLVIGDRGVDPATGKELWKLPEGGLEYHRAEGNWLVGARYVPQVDPREKASAHGYQLTPEKAIPKWSVPVQYGGTGEAGIALANGYAYINGVKNYCIKLETGEVTATQDKAPAKLNTVLEYADGRLFIWPENHHGGQQFAMLGADPKTLPLFSEEWNPPHPHTSAYSHSGIGMPVADGHIFIRGHDAIYCYDLRKAGN
jgi:outer membrane protein assembly factor BamB